VKALVPDPVLPLAQVRVLDPVRLQAVAQVHLQAVALAAHLVPRQVLDLVQHQVRRRVAPLAALPAPALVCHRHQRVRKLPTKFPARPLVRVLHPALLQAPARVSRRLQKVRNLPVKYPAHPRVRVRRQVQRPSDPMRRRLMQEDAWMQAQGPASEFRLNLAGSWQASSSMMSSMTSNMASMTVV
jgi:hypothetical protein